MAINPNNYDLEEWLRLEDENILQKQCNIFDVDGYLVAQFKTRVFIYPEGTQIGTKLSPAAPALYRTFTYDDEGNAVASVPRIAEWSQACEDAAQGGSPYDPLAPIGVPAGLKVAKTTYIYDEEMLVPYNLETTVISYTVPAEESVYLRDVTGSGDNKGTYSVLIDGAKIKTKRSWWCDFNVEFEFSSANGGILVEGGSTIALKVINDSKEAVTFDGSIGYVLL